MSRVLIRGEWYSRLGSTSLLEHEYEKLMAQQAPLLFPDYELVEFRCDISSEHGIRQPDFALIERTYRSWWVLEVELAHHSLLSHVLPQVRVFATAEYGSQHAGYLAARSHLDRHRLEEMMKGAPPKVLVAVNQPMPDWIPALRGYDALLAVLEIYRSEKNDHILRANGDYPDPPTDVLTRCRVEALMPRALTVDSPAGLGVPDGGAISVEYEGNVTEWRRKDVQNRVWLMPPRGGSPLPIGLGSFDLVRRSDGRLVFLATRARGGRAA